MEHQAHSMDTEVTFHHGPAENTKRIWRTFWILLFITIGELALGLVIYFFPGMSEFMILLIKGIIVILTLAKAFYIIAIFMHLGDEIKNMIMTVALPCLLFVWFIAAFLWDGKSFNNLRNEFDPYYKESTTTPVDKSKQDAQQPGTLH